MQNIVLVGFMGTGKTSVGKLLAERLGRGFWDIDEIIENKEQISITEIFEKKGEPYFRRIEKELIKEVAQKQGIVISAGGGAIVDTENFENLKRNGIIICLKASPAIIIERVKGLTTRPLLNVSEPKKRIQELLKKREVYYNKADLSIDTDELSVEGVVKSIRELMKFYQKR